MLALPLPDRPRKNVVCLFDVDGTLTPARQIVSAEMLDLLARLRSKVAIGFVGGSDLAKQVEQLAPPSLALQVQPNEGADPDAPVVTTMFDYCFSENGLVAYRLGKSLGEESFISNLGEDRYNEFARFVLRELSEIEEVKVRRGTFIELRRGMVNISPIGRSATIQERDEYETIDLEHGIRKRLIEKIKARFPNYGLTYSIGGKISFDVFPTGWDKTYCLRYIPDDAEIHFFGDKTMVGGNDYEIYKHPRTIGHSVKDPAETMRILKELFFTDEA